MEKTQHEHEPHDLPELPFLINAGTETNYHVHGITLTIKDPKSGAMSEPIELMRTPSLHHKGATVELESAKRSRKEHEPCLVFCPDQKFHVTIKVVEFPICMRPLCPPPPPSIQGTFEIDFEIDPLA